MQFKSGSGVVSNTDKTKHRWVQMVFCTPRQHQAYVSSNSFVLSHVKENERISLELQINTIFFVFNTLILDC